MTSRSGSKFEWAIYQSLLDTIEISWSSVVRDILASHLQQDSSFQPLEKLWRLKSGIWVQIDLSFVLFEVHRSCKLWAAREVRVTDTSLHCHTGVWSSSGCTCDLYWHCCLKKKKFSGCGVNVMLLIAQKTSNCKANPLAVAQEKRNKTTILDLCGKVYILKKTAKKKAS